MTKRRLTSTASLLVLLVLCISWVTGPTVKAKSLNLGAQDFQNGQVDYNQVQLGSSGSTLSLQRGDIGSWSGGDGMQFMPTEIYGESDMVYGPNDTLYLLTNRESCRLFRYTMETQQWDEASSPPVGCGTGASLIYDGDHYMYYTAGNNTSGYFRYDIATDTWKQLADSPGTVGKGGSTAYVKSGSGAVYMFRGGSSVSFYKYDVSSNTWTAMAPFPTTGTVDWGASLVWDNGNYIYADTSCHGEFKKYSIATNSWIDLPASGSSGCPTSSLMWANGSVYLSGIRVYGGEVGYMRQYDPNGNAWTDKATPPVGEQHDWIPTGAYDGKDTIYQTYGAYERRAIYKYSISKDSWEGTSLFPSSGAVFAHGQLMYDNGTTAYYFAGNNYSTLYGVYQVNLQTQQITQVGAQFQSNNGMYGVYFNGAIYAQPYFNGTQFWKFDIASKDWSQLADMPFSNGSWTPTMVDGGNGYLYTTFPGRTNFYRYSDATGWQAMASSPAGTGTGGGVTRIGQTIYVLAGAQQPYLMAYNITANTWSMGAETPVGGIDHGSFLTSDTTRYLYAGLGDRTDPHNREVYQYDTTTSAWRRIADMPQSTDVGASAVYDTVDNKLWVAQGVYYSHLWSWSPTSNNFVAKGTWYSKTLDLTQAQSWQSLQATVSGSGTATMYTRTSSSGHLWSDWQQVSGTTVSSPPSRYLQIKVVLSGDGSSSPQVSGLQLDYSQETDPPNLPSQFAAYGNKGGEVLTSGQTYVYEHPYFSWSGADDGPNGAGVAGYYVYFGTDSNADPAVAGSYQTTTDYTVTTAMAAGDVDYLRIKVKDRLGNVSDAATYFSYRYFYISPSGSILHSTKQDIGQGTNSSLAVADDGTMSLTQQAAGAWDTGTMQMLPSDTSGGATTVAGDYLYVLRGNSTGTFWRYNLTSQGWETLANEPDSVNNGSSMSWDGGNYIYAMTGNSNNTFFRYNIQNGLWETLPFLPAFAQAGSSLQYIGNGKVAIMFAGSTEFYLYDTTSGNFTSGASLPAVVHNSNSGSGLWYDGKDTVYAYFGAYDSGTTNRKSLAKYSISQDAWRPLSSPPVEVFYAQNTLVGDGHGHLYVFANDYTFNQSHNNMAEEYDITNDSWKVLPNFTGEDVRGTATSDGDRYVYIIPSYGSSRQILRYDTWNDLFTPTVTSVPTWQRLPWDQQSGYGWQEGQASTAVYDGADSVYVIGANEGNFSQFIRVSVSTGAVDHLREPPHVGIYGSLAYSNGTLYYMSAGNRTNFYKYDPVSGAWISLANVPGSVYRPGSGSLIALKDGSLLALRGNNNQMYRYVPDSGKGTWQVMASAPGTIYYGAAVYDGNNKVYVMHGNNSKSFYVYTVSSNSWSTAANMPDNASQGAAMMFHNGLIYAMRGNGSTDMYTYDPSTDTWSTAPSAPDYFRYGSNLVPINNDYALGFAGQSSPDIWRFNFPGANKAYQGIATHISEPMTVNGLFDYAGIQAKVTQPANTKVEFWTRTSPDGVTWDNWSIADQTKQFSDGTMSVHVTSKPQEYTQVKIILYSYDNEYTPTVSNYSLDYYYDTTPPSDPTLLTAYADSSKSQALTNNTWYNMAKPDFDWPDPGQAGGATDGPLGSNLKGYWVYVGTDPTAVPQTAGVFVTGTDYVPTLTKSGKYYVRLQAVDITGNVDSNIFAPFIYKFDNVPPTNPALITVTPSGFTGKNNYTFQWPNGFDGDSGIDQYCYHTGALSGPLAVETCQSNLDLTNLAAAYQPGTDVLYLRTRDIAGNYSPSYTQVSYYFSTDPPSPVTNLRAVPPTSQQNLFAFIWDYPTLFSGDPDQLQYCYAINSLPTPTNTTCTNDMFISAFKAATQQGTNTLYMVAKDEAGNANWNNYASANFIANTVSPGIPLNLVVNDTSDSVTGRWSLTLTWDPPTFVGNGVADYVLERSTDDHTFTVIGRGTNTAYVDLTVDPGTTYYYRVRAADNVDNEGGPSAVVAQSAKGSFASPPKIVSDPKSEPSFDQANISWVTDRVSTSFVYYGTSPTQLTQSKGTLDSVNEHSIVITGLQPDTIYYFKVQSFDNNRSYDLATAYSQLYTFRTSQSARIFNVQSSDITLDSAIVNWQTSVPTQARIEYGTTTDYGLAQDDASGFTASHIFKLTNLASGTTFHFRIVATTSYGSVIRSDDYTLTTIARPRVSSIAFQPISNANTIAVRVTWTTNVPTSSDITYTGLGVKKDTADGTLVTKHDMVIDDLASNTDYTFNIQGRDQYGNQAVSDVQKWHSGVDTKAPTVSNFSVDAGTMQTAGGQAKAQLIITWHTDEPATTQVQYGGASGKLSKKSPFDPQPTVDHVVVLSGLELAQVYRIQPLSRDISNNAGFGAQVATVTPDIEQSPLDIVINTLQKIFRL